MDLRLEVVILPVTDVDKAKHFYETGLGCRLDADVSPREGRRIVQVTPPGSPCSIIFGDGVTAAQPGAGGSLMLVVDDIAASREELVSRGAEVSEVFHAEGGGYGAGFHPGTTEGRAPGPDPDGLSYATFASFSDPDGNTWLLQEITERLPGRA
jgi:catechol 2,3-dioxygenase-like lactoylglutathione lyase family enzyme